MADVLFTEDLVISEDITQAFNEQGYIIVRNLLSSTEIDKLKTALEHDEGILTKAYNVNDGSEGNSRMCVWNHHGNDITGLIARSKKVATTMEKLLGGEVYHYHTKLMMKEPVVGGKWVWHQDYGYWYTNGAMYPDMATCFLAVDRCSTENGCIQVIPGSHRAGRIDHFQTGGQYEADPERVKWFKENLGICSVELDPGDAVFFHSNLLHTSAKNASKHRRWAFLMAYNRASNNPIKKHHHPRYCKLHKVPNSAILNCSTATDLRGKGFLRRCSGDAVEFICEDEHLN